jgi:hypothetical protein
MWLEKWSNHTIALHKGTQGPLREKLQGQACYDNHNVAKEIKPFVTCFVVY